MIKFFRKIRYDLMEKNKTGKYLKYAIGEIILVVIGILIALQINTWNEDYKNTKKERGYLINLQQDLRADSLRLSELKNDFELAVKSKKKFEKIIEGQPTTNDSLIFYVNNQIDLLTDFVPNSSTFDELKNSNGLNLISNPQLKRQIVTLYNSYADLILKLKLGTEKSQILYAHLSKYVNNINTITSDEIHVLLNDNFFKNQMLLNYLYTQFSITLKAYGNCLETLNVINKELKHV
ncbi:DUF6090 family protein [Sediminicola arcticus]|jgi:hypothetical protein|uniref:DUF6090 family protein n=2 Tax=Sediminicola arcticus TaxID=1574308 RepID=A0ABV2SY10_9FLAO